MTTIEAGYTWRAGGAPDFASLARFVHHYDTTVGDFSDFTEEDLREFERMRRFDYATGSWMAEISGDIAAFGLAWPDDDATMYTFGLVHPEHTGRGLGTACIQRAEDRARALLRAPEGLLRSFVDVKDAAGCELHRRRGYSMVRTHYTMHRMLPASPGPELPAGVTVRTTARDEAPLLHALVEDTFAQHWGHVPRSFEEFDAEVLQRADTDPGLWWVAEADGEPVAVLIGTVDGATGWVADLGVRASWRGRGIGIALLHVAFDEFGRRGATEAALGVDASNETGAVRLYERVGMSARKVYETYELRISR